MMDTERPHLKLEASCTLREAPDLHFSLLAADPAANPFLLDGGAVERIDTSGLQLLAAFATGLRLSGRSVRWTAASPEVRRCSERLDLARVLGLEPAASGESA